LTKTIGFIDLFCGCGGWTEGMTQQGFKCLYSVDNWAPAARAHSLNHPGAFEDDQVKDIFDVAVFEQIKDLLGRGEADLIIGSPPCTQFSFANRGGSGNVVKGMLLVRRFFEVIDFVQNELKRPDFPWVMENVPRLKDFIEQECIDSANGIYAFNYTERPDCFYQIHIPKVVILNAADMGAPQRRSRLYCGNFDIPKPEFISPEIKEHPNKLQEFSRIHGMAMGALKNLPRWRTLRDILEAFPDPLQGARAGMSVHDPNYPEIVIPEEQLTDHFYDTSLFPGAELFEAQELKQHHAFYGVMQFPDDLDAPSRTLMATEMRLSRETIIIPKRFDTHLPTNKRPYSVILEEHRTPKIGGFRRLTIRESASLMGFPITFQFVGESSSTKHKQLGNAVSPQISNAFARMFEKRILGTNSTKKVYPFFQGGKLNQCLRKYNKTEQWKNETLKKTNTSFRRHLRCTKYDGQRVDLLYSGDDNHPWETSLSIGSGKSFKEHRLGPSYFQELDAMWISIKQAFDQYLFLDIEQIRAKAVELGSTTPLDIHSFLEPSMDKQFSEGGDILPGTPLDYVERAAEELAKEALLTISIEEAKGYGTEIRIGTNNKKIDLFVLTLLQITVSLCDRFKNLSKC